MEKLFENAIRGKYRFNYKGVVSVEDLWDLTLKDLDGIFKGLNSKLKETQEESLLGSKTKEDTEISNKIEIIKYIVKAKQEEEAKRLSDKDSKEKKQKILEILANKKDSELQGKSIEELEKMLAEV